MQLKLKSDPAGVAPQMSQQEENRVVNRSWSTAQSTWELLSGDEPFYECSIESVDGGEVANSIAVRLHGVTAVKANAAVNELLISVGANSPYGKSDSESKGIVCAEKAIHLFDSFKNVMTFHREVFNVDLLTVTRLVELEQIPTRLQKLTGMAMRGHPLGLMASMLSPFGSDGLRKPEGDVKLTDISGLWHYQLDDILQMKSPLSDYDKQIGGAIRRIRNKYNRKGYNVPDSSPAEAIKYLAAMDLIRQKSEVVAVLFDNKKVKTK